MKELEKFKKIETEDQFQELIKHIFTSNEKYFFRGQTKATWDLKSTYTRGTATYYGVPYIFEERYKTLKNKKMKETKLEALSWMQHFGLKTPLIDFTSDILHAIWFAFSEDKEKKDKEKKEEFRSLFILKPKAEIKYDIDDFEEKEQIYKCPLTIERGLSQKSYFILENIDWNEKVKSKDNIIKIEISDEIKEYISKWLYSKSITGMSIYPDLKGIMIDFEKTSPAHFFDKALALQNIGNNEEAIKWLDKSISINDRNDGAYHNKGVALCKLGRFEEAIECCDKAIEINGRNDDAYVNKGMALGKLGRFEEAIECCDKAIEINDRNDGAYANKGAALCNLDRLEEAIECCDKAIEINGRNDDAYVNKGLALGDLGKLNECIVCCDKAIEINGRHDGAYVNKGMALGKLGRLNECIVCCDKAIEINGRNDGAYVNKGMALDRLERLEEAIECYDKAIEINDCNDNAYVNKGAALLDLKRTKEALECATKALEINPKNQNAIKLKEIVIKQIEADKNKSNKD